VIFNGFYIVENPAKSQKSLDFGDISISKIVLRKF